jgi:hypothetical protein
LNKAQRLKDRIIKEGCIKISYSFIINALKKGWAEIPVKPLSVQNIEASLTNILTLPTNLW